MAMAASLVSRHHARQTRKGGLAAELDGLANDAVEGGLDAVLDALGQVQAGLGGDDYINRFNGNLVKYKNGKDLRTLLNNMHIRYRKV